MSMCLLYSEKERSIPEYDLYRWPSFYTIFYSARLNIDPRGDLIWSNRLRDVGCRLRYARSGYLRFGLLGTDSDVEMRHGYSSTELVPRLLRRAA